MPKTLLLLITALFCTAILQAQTATNLNREIKIAPDSVIDYLNGIKKELSIKHPGFYRYHSKPEMDRFVDSVAATITDSLPAIDIYRKYKPVFTKISCLHTGVGLPKAMHEELNKQTNLLPLRLFFRDNKAFIVTNYSSEKSIEAGDELISINGRSIPEVLQVLLAAIPSDGYNRTMKYKALYHFFPTWYRNMIEVTDHFDVVVLHNGQQQVYKVGGAMYKTMAGNGFLDMPVYNKQLDLKIEKGTGILTVHTFAKSAIKAGDQQFKSFIKSSFQQLRQTKTNNLIIDLRNNTGGTDANAAYLSSYFFDRPYRYWDRIEVTEPIAKEIKGKYRLFFKKPVQQDSTWLWKKSWITKEFNFYRQQKPAKNNYKGNVYVLIDGFCMSSCADLAAVLSYNKKAVFIGEETGGGFQGNNSGMMPESSIIAGLVMTVPLQKYVTAVDAGMNIGRGTIPDHPVNATLSEIMGDKDVAMQLAFDLIRKQ